MRGGGGTLVGIQSVCNCGSGALVMILLMLL